MKTGPSASRTIRSSASRIRQNSQRSSAADGHRARGRDAERGAEDAAAHHQQADEAGGGAARRERRHRGGTGSPSRSLVSPSAAPSIAGTDSPSSVRSSVRSSAAASTKASLRSLSMPKAPAPPPVPPSRAAPRRPASAAASSRTSSGGSSPAASERSAPQKSEDLREQIRAARLAAARTRPSPPVGLAEDLVAAGAAVRNSDKSLAVSPIFRRQLGLLDRGHQLADLLAQPWRVVAAFAASARICSVSSASSCCSSRSRASCSAPPLLRSSASTSSPNCRWPRTMSSASVAVSAAGGCVRRGSPPRSANGRAP